MTFQQLTNYLIVNILKRGVLAADGVTLTMFDMVAGVSPTQQQAPFALNLAHLELQRVRDWTCQEDHDDFDYDCDGIVLLDDVKRITEVAYQHKQHRTHYQLDPATRDEMRALRTARRDFLAAVGGSPAIVNQFVSPWDYKRHCGIERRWWIQERSLFTTESWHQDACLRVDSYKFLAPYSQPLDEDWFSRFAWDALLYKAAEIGFVGLWEDDQLALFTKLSADKLQQAMKLDQAYSDGGDTDIVRPPRLRMLGSR